jgi:D-arabinose 1-dehydrogenase-like Zn-dependent alcohol dehydrogenase
MAFEPSGANVGSVAVLDTPNAVRLKENAACLKHLLTPQPQTQEMLDFCAEHGVLAETETIHIQEIETAFARMVKNDIRYRFVIDMKSLQRSV